jgi:hypothetical protein
VKVNNLVLWQVLTIVFLLIAEEKCVEICLENKSSSWVCDSFLEFFPSPDLASFTFNSDDLLKNANGGREQRLIRRIGRKVKSSQKWINVVQNNLNDFCCKWTTIAGYNNQLSGKK